MIERVQCESGKWMQTLFNNIDLKPRVGRLQY